MQLGYSQTILIIIFNPSSLKGVFIEHLGNVNLDNIVIYNNYSIINGEGLVSIQMTDDNIR